MPENPSAVLESTGGKTSGPETAARDRLALILLLAAVFVVFLNETVMSVAIPPIMDDLGISASAGQWLTTAFALTMAVVIPITGWLLQRLNTRPVFVTAMSLFVAGTVIAATSPGFEVLVLGRVVQASGTAIMMPLMMTTVMTLVAPAARGRIMGRIAIVMSVAPAIGPALSGVLLEVLPWRGLFWVMLPLAVAMLAIGIAWVPNVSEPRRVPLDVLSVIVSAIAFSGLVYGLSSLGQSAEGEGGVPPSIPLTIGVVFLVAFVWRQLMLQRRDAALLDLRTFTHRTFTMSILMLSIGMVALFGTIIVLPIYVQYGLLQPPIVAGLMLLPGGLAMGLLGPLVGRLYDRVGPTPLVVPGAIVVSGVLWSFTLLTETSPLWFVIAGHVGLSLGLAFLFTPLFTAGLGSLPKPLYSHGSATVATIQQVAGAAGTAMFVALLAVGIVGAGGADSETADPQQIAAGSHLAFLGGAIVSLVVVGVSFFVRRPADEPAEHPAAPARTEPGRP